MKKNCTEAHPSPYPHPRLQLAVDLEVRVEYVPAPGEAPAGEPIGNPGGFVRAVEHHHVAGHVPSSRPRRLHRLVRSQTLAASQA